MGTRSGKRMINIIIIFSREEERMAINGQILAIIVRSIYTVQKSALLLY